jgi:hypothetical protein
VINLGVLTPDQKEFWLIDPATIPQQRGPVRITPGGLSGGVEIEVNPHEANPPADPGPEQPAGETPPPAGSPG